MTRDLKLIVREWKYQRGRMGRNNRFPNMRQGQWPAQQLEEQAWPPREGTQTHWNSLKFELLAQPAEAGPHFQIVTLGEEKVYNLKELMSPFCSGFPEKDQLFYQGELCQVNVLLQKLIAYNKEAVFPQCTESLWLWLMLPTGHLSPNMGWRNFLNIQWAWSKDA